MAIFTVPWILLILAHGIMPPTERFFRSFKTEWIPRDGYENIDEASTAITDYIWDYYQTVRPHTFNNYLTPAEKEKRYFNKNLLSGVLN